MKAILRLKELVEKNKAYWQMRSEEDRQGNYLWSTAFDDGAIAACDNVLKMIPDIIALEELESVLHK
jgi:hypothetical protein